MSKEEVKQVLLSQIQPDSDGSAIPFISIEEQSGRFEVASQAMVFLESLPRNKRVAIVSIAGPYRTGKSFLANRLLNQNRGFEIGSTTQASTKGIWMWNRAVDIGPDTVMILIDTEGLASTERSTNIDIKIFSLAILLSSLFIYNQMGPITESSLEDLALVGNLSSHISINKGKSPEQIDFRQYFPSFFWVMRDFYHDLEGRTPKQYLEECLQEAPGYTKDVMKKNKIRQAIQHHFKERECFTIIRPVTDESKLAHVESVSWDAVDGLKPQFKTQVKNLVNQVGKKLKPKVISGKHLNGSMLLSLALEYTESLNSKETPTVLTAFDRVVQAETVKTIDEAFDSFKADINEQLAEDHLPMATHEFKKVIKKLIKKYKLILQKQLAQILSFSEILQETQKFKLRIKDITDIKYQQNYSASYHFSRGLLNNLLQTVIEIDEAPQTNLHLRRWAQLLKDYKESGIQSSLQWQVLVSSIAKMPADAKQLILKMELIDQADTPTEMGMDDEETYSTSHQPEESKKVDQGLSEIYLLDIFEKFIENLIESLNTQLTGLRVNLNESQQNERRLTQSRKQNDSMIDLQRQQNEELANLKNDLDVRIENLKRDVSYRKQQFEQLQQVKEAELRTLKSAQEKQLRECDEEEQSLSTQKQTLTVQHQELQGRVQLLESEKRKEISLIQNEIKKLEEDIEGLKNKMKSKENNPFYVQVNQFFSEVGAYMEEYRKLCSQQDDSREQKKELFALQRRLADVEYSASQKELAFKKQLDQQLRNHKDKLQQAFQAKQAEVEAEKQRLQTFNDRKTAFEQQLVQSIGLIQDAKERQMTLAETRDIHKRQSIAVKEVRIKEMSDNISETKKSQVRMEDKIFSLSIENKQRQEDKEMMIMLLPHIYNAIQGRTNKLREYIQQIENEGLKNKVLKMLQAYKIPGVK